MKYCSPYQKVVGAFAYAQNSIMKAIKSTNFKEDISILKRDLNINNHLHQQSHQNRFLSNSNNDPYFRAYHNKRGNPSLSPIKERDSATYESKPRTYNNIYTADKDPYPIRKDDEYYNQKPTQSFLSINYLKWFLMSINSFRFDSMLMYNKINIYDIQSSEISVPLLILCAFMFIMILRGRFRIKCLYFFILLFPIMHCFLMNQMIISLMKFRTQLRKIDLIKSITFFYSAFIPICIANICFIILRRRIAMGIICLIFGIVYSACLNEKYHRLYCGLDYNATKVILMLNLVLYSFFLLVIV